MSTTRKDGREPLQLRGRELAVSLYSNCDGSVRYSQGQTSVICTLIGPTQENNSGGGSNMSETLGQWKHNPYESGRVIVSIEYVSNDSISKIINTIQSKRKSFVVSSSSSSSSQMGLDALMRSEMWHEYITTHDAHKLHSFVCHVLNSIIAKEKFPRCVLYFNLYVVNNDGSLLSTILNACMACVCDAGIACRTSAMSISIVCLEPVIESYDTNTIKANQSTKMYLVDPTLEEELVSEEQYYDLLQVEKNENTKCKIKKSMATFVLANPSITKRAGLLATHFTSTCVNVNSLESLLKHNKDEDNNEENENEKEQKERKDKVNTQIDAESLFEMIDLAHRASPMLFDFLRQCNVPLDDDNSNSNYGNNNVNETNEESYEVLNNEDVNNINKN